MGERRSTGKKEITYTKGEGAKGYSKITRTEYLEGELNSLDERRKLGLADLDHKDVTTLGSKRLRSPIVEVVDEQHKWVYKLSRRRHPEYLDHKDVSRAGTSRSTVWKHTAEIANDLSLLVGAGKIDRMALLRFEATGQLTEDELASLESYSFEHEFLELLASRAPVGLLDENFTHDVSRRITAEFQRTYLKPWYKRIFSCKYYPLVRARLSP